MKDLLQLIILWMSMFLVNSLQAQKKSQFGINLFTEAYPTPRIKPAGGVAYEFRLSQKQALQTALLYRTASMQALVNVSPGQPFVFTVSRRYVSTYVLYKRDVKLFALSAGPTLEYLASWKQKGSGPHQISSYRESPRIKPGFLTTVSRAFPVSNHLILEPQLRFGNTRSISFDATAMLTVGVIAWLRSQK